MSDLIRALLDPGSLRSFLFPPNSRYHGVEIATLTTPDGKTTAYLRRRFVPDPDRLAAIKEHAVAQGERLDLIAARELGDPELFWRLCDANRAISPDELERTGRRLKITLPEGLQGT